MFFFHALFLLMEYYYYILRTIHVDIIEEACKLRYEQKSINYTQVFFCLR